MAGTIDNGRNGIVSKPARRRYDVIVLLLAIVIVGHSFFKYQYSPLGGVIYDETTFFLDYLALTGTVAATLVLNWYTPKLALGPTAGAVMLFGLGLSSLTQRLQWDHRRVRRRKNQPVIESSQARRVSP